MSEHPHPLVRVHRIGVYNVEPDGPLPDGRDVGPEGQPGWRQDWFVSADLRDGNEVHCFSASLTLALNEGTFSDPWERPIPVRTMERLEKLAAKLANAGLY